jgi:hypothetical protein
MFKAATAATASTFIKTKHRRKIGKQGKEDEGESAQWNLLERDCQVNIIAEVFRVSTVNENFLHFWLFCAENHYSERGEIFITAAAYASVL